ncbi:MAG: thioredoxin family protein [Turicibacter sp.]|nr:thioredoxin family protein [Turicibacter sp.]
MNKKSRGTELIIGAVTIFVVLIGLVMVFNVFGGGSRLDTIGLSEMNDILADGSGEGTFVYFGRPTCPHCVTFEPILEDVLDDLGVRLPYFNADLADQEDIDRRREVFAQLGLEGVPKIAYIINGEAVDVLIGVQPASAVHEFFEDNGGIE